MHELAHTIIRQEIHLQYEEKLKFAPLSIKIKNKEECEAVGRGFVV
jgi:hypothetical protein